MLSMIICIYENRAFSELEKEILNDEFWSLKAEIRLFLVKRRFWVVKLVYLMNSHLCTDATRVKHDLSLDIFTRRVV